MADPIISPREFQLLKKEIEALGEQLNQEQLERRADVERLRLRIEELQRTRSLRAVPSSHESSGGFARHEHHHEHRALRFSPPMEDALNEMAVQEQAAIEERQKKKTG